MPEAEAKMRNSIDRRVNTSWKVLALNRFVSIGILPNVNSMSLNRVVNSAQIACFRSGRLKNNQTKSRRRMKAKVQLLLWKVCNSWVVYYRTLSRQILQRVLGREKECWNKFDECDSQRQHCVKQTSEPCADPRERGGDGYTDPEPLTKTSGASCGTNSWWAPHQLFFLRKNRALHKARVGLDVLLPSRHAGSVMHASRNKSSAVPCGPKWWPLQFFLVLELIKICYCFFHLQILSVDEFVWGLKISVFEQGVNAKKHFLSQHEMIYVGRCTQLCGQCVQARMRSPISVWSMERCPSVF